MNEVFLAQIGGSMPPADRSPQPPLVYNTDNNSSLASNLLGALFGSKAASQTQLASATQEGSGDSATSRRNARPATNIQGVAVAKLNSIKRLKNETTTPKSEPQQTAAVQPKTGLQQEANAAPPERDDINIVSALPTVPADAFDSRWHGLENDSPKSEPAAVQPKPGLQQEANAVPPESDNINAVSALPTVPADSFDSRWHGFNP
jgi:hypothetical protein